MHDITDRFLYCLARSLLEETLLCLQELPDKVFGVGAGARTLDATNNKLTTVSPQLAQLSNLSRLVLTSNQIQELPAAVLQLQSLKVGISSGVALLALAGSRGGLAMEGGIKGMVWALVEQQTQELTADMPRQVHGNL